MSQKGSKKPNVVLICHDSVRAMDCSIYGYPKITTPFLEKIGKDAVIYKNAFSTAISTVPSHASLFTGAFISTHELFLDGDFLKPEMTTLAEVLNYAGYQTFGVCYQDDVSPSTGLHRGFNLFQMDDEPSLVKRTLRYTLKTKKEITKKKQLYEKSGKNDGKVISNDSSFVKNFKMSNLYKRIYWVVTKKVDQGADVTKGKLIRFLKSIDEKEPFFVYLHFDEAHLPYRPPIPFRYKFIDKELRNKKYWTVNQDRKKYFLNEKKMNKIDFDILRSLYNGCIAYLDMKTYEIYKILDDLKFLDNTVFIVFGDHGDNIGEHGLMSHKFCVYDSLIKIPLIIKYPSNTINGEEFEGIVQLTDILPTLLDLIGIKNNKILNQIQGNSLISNETRNKENGYAISELMKPFGNEMYHVKRYLNKYNRKMFSVRSLKYKYIWDLEGNHKFFDLIQDPDETKNVIEKKSNVQDYLRNIAEKHAKLFMKCYNKYKTEIED